MSTNTNTSTNANANAVEFRGVTYAYPEANAALRDVELDVHAGELLLVVGASGSGKSTLLRAINGLVPHTTGGTFAGDVQVLGRSTRTHKPRELVDVVGFVHQDPEAQFVVDHVERDVAFVLENLALSHDAMRRRVEEVLDALGIAHLRDRSPTTLSGGERQRAAIAGALAAMPAVLVLDEPTSQLDPQGAEDVLGALARLNADLGTTVVLAEHRLERAAPLADRVALVAAGKVAKPVAPGTGLATYPGAPSVTRLGRTLGWDPPPLTVRDARRSVNGIVDLSPPLRPVPSFGDVLLEARALRVQLGGNTVLRDVTFGVRAGEVAVLLGRNGAGKTTLLRALGNLIKPDRGTVTGKATVAYVPQDPNTLLFAPSVRRELRATLRLLGRVDDDNIERWLHALHLHDVADRHPRSLSGGERQRVAIAAVAVGGADVLLLDEPTRGMDALSRAALEHAIRAHTDGGGAVVLATHDIELAARAPPTAGGVGDGDIVAAGPAREVLAGSMFAPQVSRILPSFLTVEEVESAIRTHR